MSEFKVDESKSRPEQAVELQAELERIAQEGDWKKPDVQECATVTERLTPGQQRRIENVQRRQAWLAEQRAIHGRRGSDEYLGHVEGQSDVEKKLMSAVATRIRKRWEQATPEDYAESSEKERYTALHPRDGKFLGPEDISVYPAKDGDVRAHIEEAARDGKTHSTSELHIKKTRQKLSEVIFDGLYTANIVYKRNPSKFAAMDPDKFAEIVEDYDSAWQEESRLFKEWCDIEEAYNSTANEKTKLALKPLLDEARVKHEDANRHLENDFL